MKIAIEAYFDCNYGDDKMVYELLKRVQGYDVTLINLKNSKDQLLFWPFILSNTDLKIQDKSDFIHKLDEYDAIIKVGGSLFQYTGYDSSLIGRYRYYNKRKELKRLKKSQVPYYVVGSNISELKSKKIKKLYQEEISLMKSISFRDTNSLILTQKIMSETKSTAHADIVFADTKDTLPHLDKANCLGISIYNNQKNPNENQYFVTKTVDLINYYLSFNEGDVNLYCFDVYNENDTVCALAIQNAVSDRSRVHLVPYELNIKNFEAKLSEATVMLAVRFHSLIWALNQGIPCVPISYSMKTDHYLSDLKKEDKLIPMEDYYKKTTKEIYHQIMSATPLMDYEEIKKARISANEHFKFSEEWV